MSSEIVWCRERLAKYCIGNGLDIGFGGSPIVPNAICLDREEGHPERAVVPWASPPTQLVGDARQLFWFQDNVLDFVFSSHCLEDFADTQGVLREWLRVLRPGGNLVMFLPDQAAYVAHCKVDGSIPNAAHKLDWFSLNWVKECLSGFNGNVIYELWPVPGNPYSFDIVWRKTQ
jgi:SAM-dependent methyltransferase